MSRTLEYDVIRRSYVCTGSDGTVLFEISKAEIEDMPKPTKKQDERLKRHLNFLRNGFQS